MTVCTSGRKGQGVKFVEIKNGMVTVELFPDECANLARALTGDCDSVDYSLRDALSSAFAAAALAGQLQADFGPRKPHTLEGALVTESVSDRAD